MTQAAVFLGRQTQAAEGHARPSRGIEAHHDAPS